MSNIEPEVRGEVVAEGEECCGTPEDIAVFENYKNWLKEHFKSDHGAECSKNGRCPIPKDIADSMFDVLNRIRN